MRIFLAKGLKIVGCERKKTLKNSTIKLVSILDKLTLDQDGRLSRNIQETVFERVFNTPLDLEHYQETSIVDLKMFIGTVSGGKCQIIELRKIKK